jgi:hypothetical protein
MNQLGSSPPSAFIRGIGQAGAVVPPLQQAEAQDLDASLPVVEQPTGLDPVIQAGARERPPVIWTAREAQVETSRGPVTQDRETPPVEQPAVSVFDRIRTPTPPLEEGGGKKEDYGTQVRDAIDDLPTSDSVDTSAGPRPTVQLDGAADPAQNDENLAASRTSVEAELMVARGATEQDFGEGNIAPDIETGLLEATARVGGPAGTPGGEVGSLPPVDPALLAHFDSDAQGHLDQQVGPEMERYQAERQAMEEKATAERLDSMAEIEAETGRTRTEQRALRDGARDEVDSYRSEWTRENETVRQDFLTSSSEGQTKVSADIQAKVDTTNAEVETTLSRAEADADAERVEAEAEAERRKAEADKKDKGFWGGLASAIGDFFDAIKDGLNKLFDALRAAVKAIIEAAKAAVGALIDLARKAIVALIVAFGELLKGLVRVALAAFPEIAERITGLIDQAVAGAVDAVNALAEALKQIVNTILDALGAALDAILAAYQAFYNLILDALRFLAVGLLEILRGIANLALGFAAMLPKMMGALFEAFIGTDVTQPLPNVERTEAEIAQHEGGRIPDTAVAAEGIGPGEQAARSELANATSLTDDQVTTDGMMEMEPALLADLGSIPDGGLLDLGGAAEPVTTAQLQELAFGAAAGANGSGPTGRLPEEAAAPELDGEPGGSGPDFASMSDEEKLDYHIAQMDQQLTAPSTADAKDPTPATQDPGVPYEVKTGRLGMGTRLSFVGRQMVKGMEIWWQRNQAAVYAALVGILVVGGIVAFFTGGAGLIALLQLLLQVMMVYFIADAILRIKGHLADFFSKSWVGDTEAGGTALAKAIAVVISEFVLEYVLRGVGRVLKRLKGMVKATRAGAAVARTTGRAARAIRRGATATVRTARRAGAGARRAIARGRRFVLRGFRRGGLRGARSRRQVRQRVLDIFGFRRIWMERHGRRIELWAEFNGKVLLSTGEIIDDDKAGPVGSSGTFRDTAGQKHPGVVVDYASQGNLYSRRLAGLGTVARQDEYTRLTRSSSPKSRIYGGEPRPNIRKSTFDEVAERHRERHPKTRQLTDELYDEKGEVFGNIKDRKSYELGHARGWEDHRLKRARVQVGMTWEEYTNFVNSPRMRRNYKLEEPSRNRSRVDEMPLPYGPEMELIRQTMRDFLQGRR